MTTTTKNAPSTPIPGHGVLTALRALAGEPSHSLADHLSTADQQAALLHNLLPGASGHMLRHLTSLIPSIMIEYVDIMPVAGISFWGNGHWYIHIRTRDPVDVQQVTALHELKHIIDHPLRRQQPELLSDSDWERLADRFAAGVLAHEPKPITALGERGSIL